MSCPELTLSPKILCNMKVVLSISKTSSVFAVPGCSQRSTSNCGVMYRYG